MKEQGSQGKTAHRWIDQIKTFIDMSLEEAMRTAEDREEWHNIMENI